MNEEPQHLLQHNVDDPTARYSPPQDRYHYSLFHCTHATYQLGERYWSEFFPIVVDVLLQNQNPDGSRDPEALIDEIYGIYNGLMHHVARRRKRIAHHLSAMTQSWSHATNVDLMAYGPNHKEVIEWFQS